MAIKYYEDEKVFKLDTKNSSYVIALVDVENFICHAYYGKKLPDYHVRHLLRIDENPFVPSKNNRDRGSFNDSAFFEYPTAGIGDYRTPAFEVKAENGTKTAALTYKSHEIYKGKKKLEGLPATFVNEGDDCDTLELTAEDKCLGIEVTLVYSTFVDSDCITRSVRVKNVSGNAAYLERTLSASVDFEGNAFDFITLHGSWARERHINRRPVTVGTQMIRSFRGESGHQQNSSAALVSKGCTYTSGEAYGFNFVYSGNFEIVCEVNQFGNTRVEVGINHDTFEWKLEEGAEFVAPEVIMTYSAEGLNKMAQNFHDIIRNNLIRSSYKNKPRPVLINNWEATYFDFDEKKLYSIAEEAKKLGIEMLVMDDGWFGNRSSDNMSLGDWQVNEEKLRGGLKALVDKVNALGLKFGIWFEPEMISPDSDLYRAHPEWAVKIDGREPVLMRNQLVLDITRKEVRDYIYGEMKKVLSSANIEYVKWDMNRQLCDLYSAELSADRQGEFSHRYVLALYEMQEKLITDFPELLLENCSGGGARFDAGMLYFSPQIWCSDDTDAIERCYIQEGTELMYPLSSMGAHVSDCPNHATGRNTPFETRGNVALSGTFGYELDVTKISENDRNQIPGQIDTYHKYNELIRTGDYYRIASLLENGVYDCWAIVAKDKSEALVTYVEGMRRPNVHSQIVKLVGLDENALYALEGTEDEYNGAVLMYGGFSAGGTWGDYSSKLFHFIKKQ